MSSNTQTNLSNSERAIVAWDIETCPIPDENLNSSQRDRLEKEVAILRQRQPELEEEEARRLALSVHPFLGWICCISAVAGTMGGGHRTPVSFTAGNISEEKELLQLFWDNVQLFRGNPIWVTFNGKRFDVPFVLARSAHYGLIPSRTDIADTYPYKHAPHADLCGAWPCNYTLNDMCSLLNVTSSKTDFNGSMVADAVATGHIERVIRYCEADVVATWQCYQRLQAYLK